MSLIDEIFALSSVISWTRLLSNLFVELQLSASAEGLVFLSSSFASVDVDDLSLLGLG